MVRSCSIEAGRAERSVSAASLPSRVWCDAAAVLKVVSSWLRPGEQAATALKACVIAVLSVPLWASNTARASAACCRGGSPGEATAEDAGEGTAVGAVAGAGEATAEGAVAG